MSTKALKKVSNIGKIGVLGGLTAAVALVAAGCGSSSASGGSSPVTVHLGYFPNLTHAPALVGVAQGIFARDLGTDKLDASQTFSAGPAENQALLSGSIDIAFEGPSSALSAYSSSVGAVKIIAGAASGGAGLVTKASITQPSQLKGKTIASPQLANTQDVALRYWLKQQGFSTTTSGGGDVSVQPSSTGNGTIVTEFKAGSIDGGWVPEPYESQMLAAGGHLLVDEATLWPGGNWATTNVVVRTAFLQEHPATVKRFLKGLVDTLGFMQANPSQAQSAFNQQVASLQGGKSLSSALLATAWSRLKFTADPLAATLQTQVTHGVAVGLLKQPSNLAGIYSLAPLNSVLEAAGQQKVPGL
ncbi:MAG TPA: ABC transporter substrate-binding protein [Acidimicrobiales bacterium]|nr:ABC transporter substrate-binding protein [Acidimicrobiales bacterium]